MWSPWQPFGSMTHNAPFRSAQTASRLRSFVQIACMNDLPDTDPSPDPPPGGRPASGGSLSAQTRRTEAELPKISDGVIGERFSLSRNTLCNHDMCLYSKIGVGRRSAAASSAATVAW